MEKHKSKSELSEFEQKLRESQDAQRSAKQNGSLGLHQQEDSFKSESVHKTIPVIEEQLHIDKKTVETGRVHISKSVHQEEVTVDIPTIDEEVDVKRVPVNEFVDSEPPQVRYEGDTMIIPVLKEVSVVVKRLMVTEELHVTKRKIETPATQNITLLKEEVRVNRTDMNNQDPV